MDADRVPLDSEAQDAGHATPGSVASAVSGPARQIPPIPARALSPAQTDKIK
jgi:hypothetical protein